MPDNTLQIEKRKFWISTLARSDTATLQKYWDALTQEPKVTFLRKPEIGAVMMRARVGGAGKRFNFGEATITRCSVMMNERTVGHGYTLGRNKKLAELAAKFDALLQTESQQFHSHFEFIQNLAEAQCETKELRARKVASTRVNFFTMLEEEDSEHE